MSLFECGCPISNDPVVGFKALCATMTGRPITESQVVNHGLGNQALTPKLMLWRPRPATDIFDGGQRAVEHVVDHVLVAFDAVCCNGSHDLILVV